MSAARPLDPWRWLGIPFLQVLVATVLLGVPIRIWGLQLPEPLFALPVVFAWAVIRPSVLAPFGVLLMGLFCDVFWGAPLGLWAISLLVGYGVVLAGRNMVAGQSAGMLWAWYGLVAATAVGAGYLIVTMQTQMPPNLVSVGWQYLATIILYPFAHRLIETYEDADVRFR